MGQDRTNSFAAARGDNSAMRLFAKLLRTLVPWRRLWLGAPEVAAPGLFMGVALQRDHNDESDPCYFHRSDEKLLRYRSRLGSLVVRASNSQINGRGLYTPRPPHYRSVGIRMGDRGVHTTSVCKQPPRPTQPPTLCRTGNEYRPKCGDALRLGSKGRTAHSICGQTCRCR